MRNMAPGFPTPADERQRLAALHALEILDTPPEDIYDDVVKLAAAICQVPIAIINFVDRNRQWGKALVGLASSEAPREASFCARTIVSPDGLMIVPDTLADPAWVDNDQVTGAPHLRFYAGAAIIDADGHALGSVCVADREPREIGAQSIAALRVLARQTAAHLELRKRTIELADANAELRAMTLRDELTGLANRTLLYDRLEHAIASLGRGSPGVAVLFCDLDGFKAYNDTHGHHAGDEVLRVIAQRLRAAARQVDTVARFAGDEFVVVCPGLASEADARLIVDRLVSIVARPLSIAGDTLRPQMSVGVALATKGDTADDLLRRADAAMYAAKA